MGPLILLVGGLARLDIEGRKAMPACARQGIVLAEAVGVYHVWTRCVRRSFLWLDDYLRLLDWTGRQLAAGKRGTIPQHFAPILDRLGIRRRMWLDLVTKFDRLFGHVVGRAEQLVASAARAGRRWYRGRALCGDAFG